MIIHIYPINKSNHTQEPLN